MDRMEYQQYDATYLGELIAQEEALIACREAELYIAECRLRSSNPKPATTTTIDPVATSDNGVATTSALDWILQLTPSNAAPPTWKDTKIASHLAHLSLQFQCLLRKFHFTSVVFGEATTAQEYNKALTDAKQNESYTFEGYFRFNKTVTAQIHVVFAEWHGTSSVASVQCRLVSTKRPTPDGWSWLQAEVDRVTLEESTYAPTHYLALFISNVSGYLEFDSKRRNRLDLERKQRTLTATTATECRCWQNLRVKHENAETQLCIPVVHLFGLHGKSAVDKDDSSASWNVVPALKVAWLWQWEGQKETLRIVYDQSTVYSPLYFGRYDLLQLLEEFDDDCWLTLQYIMAYCALCPSCGQQQEPSVTKWHQATVADGMGLAVTPIRASSALPLSVVLKKLASEDDDERHHYADDEDDSSQDDNDLYFGFAHEDSDYQVGLSDHEIDVDLSPMKRSKPNPEWDGSSIGTVDTPAVAGHERHSPFRLSPSGRRRSDYEMKRCIRIQRNENMLTQLGFDTARTVETWSKDKKRCKVRSKSLGNRMKEFEQATGKHIQGDSAAIWSAAKSDNEEQRVKGRLKRRLQKLKTFSASKESLIDTSDSGGDDIEKRKHSLTLPSLAAKLTTKAIAQIRPPGATGRCIETKDGCLIPKSGPVRISGSSLFKRPVGRAPTGFNWNATRGAWEPLDFSEKSLLKRGEAKDCDEGEAHRV